MAYTFDQVEYELAVAQVVTSTGNKVTWAPGYIPHIIRACSYAIVTASTVTATVLNFTSRAKVGDDTGITAGDIAILNILLVAVNTAYAVGKVVYKDGINKKLTPGQELVVNVGTASTAGAGNISIFAEPSYEMPANISAMIPTT